MRNLNNIYLGTLLIASLIRSAGLHAESTVETNILDASPTEHIAVDVYKSPNCGCCEKWIDHIKQAGFKATIHHPPTLNALKSKLGLPQTAQSCHTAVTEQGFIFEGHVPSKFMTQFTQNPPKEAMGLAVPKMPVGSPGMEMGDRFQPYTIKQLNKDGSVQDYAEMENYKMQF